MPGYEGKGIGSVGTPGKTSGAGEAPGQGLPALLQIASLATFPEQNPNPVIETNGHGEVTYLNPAAEMAFPDLRRLGGIHPILAGLAEITAGLRDDGRDHIERDVELADFVFEERICYLALPTGDVTRIYAHDVTARRRAERSLQEVARRVVLAEEQERRRVSRELHDEAGQALAALKISLQLLQTETDTQEVRHGLVDAVALVEQTREHIRLLAQGLRPPALDTLGLNAALEGFCYDFSRRTDLSISYRGCRLEEPVDAVRICLYRFLQEALANAARHSQAQSIKVSLTNPGEWVQLVVKDDGQGMDTFALEHHDGGGLGLLGMRERIELLSGTLAIESEMGSGTTLVALLPVGGR